jgi:hypothetical protein
MIDDPAPSEVAESLRSAGVAGRQPDGPSDDHKGELPAEVVSDRAGRQNWRQSRYNMFVNQELGRHDFNFNGPISLLAPLLFIELGVRRRSSAGN